VPSVRERPVDHLALVVTALGSFIVATVLAPLQRLGRGWLVAAAAREFEELQDFLDERVRPELNAADEALDGGDADRAQANLDVLETRFQEGENRFLREPAGALGPRCQAVAAFERGQFRHLEEALPVLTERVEVEREHRADPSEELARRREELSAAWDDKVKAYNEALDTLPDRVKGCLDELSEDG
jgi:hypothetical protein